MGGHIRLQQVIVNLLTNALDAMKGCPDPTIEVTLERMGGNAVVRVRDFGPGVPEEGLEKVFDPFFTTKQPGEGMGLGLSISYNIVKDFDGHLRVKNHAEGGAVFDVVLNMADAGPTPALDQGWPNDVAAE
ncbi:two-component system C4-dicarboxylate transport sensor histidine kinase DctB [Roseibium hamelinense]|uniref:histidine kinase n=2 Tax=Roseibium hamelinense TaxID=150831 RepID=A0A562SZE6_9HYPH|nr:two-component system C4-dicarboxylate transport sensor histidine kinase DctB [Roseibium hamelinense]